MASVLAQALERCVIVALAKADLEESGIDQSVVLTEQKM